MASTKDTVTRHINPRCLQKNLQYLRVGEENAAMRQLLLPGGGRLFGKSEKGENERIRNPLVGST